MQPAASAEGNRYIYQGKIVDKKPFSLYGLLMGLIELLRLFIMTLISTESSSTQVQKFKASKQGSSWSGGGSRVTGFGKAAQSGCAGAGG